MLISNGHLYAENYGYSFFKIAAKSLLEKEKIMIRDMAASIAMALGGTKEDWEKLNGSDT